MHSSNHGDAKPAHDDTMLAPTKALRASWSSTLRLPKSGFPPRPVPAAHADYLRRCSDEHYAWQQTTRSKPNANGNTSDTFTLHDGPPYANGPLHIGHALNKITKDIICRFQVGQGKKVSYIPGWDCHGLPIEIKALQARKDQVELDPHKNAVSIREAARELAARTVEEQKKGFREWAVMGDWDNAYKTMDPEFEIRQLEVFKQMFEKGLIYRQFKPVYWSPSSQTALAEAELEYDDNHKSLAAYVRFPVEVPEGLSAQLGVGAKKLNAVIWTTTPWTLPANKAIAVHRNMEYTLAADPTIGELVLLASSRLVHYQEILGRDLIPVRDGIMGETLTGKLRYENPFQKANGLQPIISADFVTDSSGTGLVHVAPGHGVDDYNVCATLGIPAFAPVDDKGAFTKDAFPEHPEVLAGKSVFSADKPGSVPAQTSGTEAVLKHLSELGLVQATHEYRHKYPIDWRTKQPVITRATAQWFANADGLKDGALKAISNVNFFPETGRPRLESFIRGRSQWCISRQRAWGVPIPALYLVAEDNTREAIMNSETIQHIIDVIKVKGIDSWWTDSEDDPVWKPEKLPSGKYVRGRDTMDVWFDSGTSWTLLPQKSNQAVADVYLEGTDQHRGWFQSSLLTHVATQDLSSSAVKAPFGTLITHGFTLDSEGRKMSKSLGNVISPAQIMSGELLPPVKRKKQRGVKQEQSNGTHPTYDAMGPDALRLWAASSDYTRDVTIGQPVLQSVTQALHKYRTTFKWLLGVLSLPTCPPTYTSFNTKRAELAVDLAAHRSDHETLRLADCFAALQLADVSQEVHGHYGKYEFFKGVNALNKYIANDLSAFYFETLKDRIYTGTLQDCQQAQGVAGVIFYELLQMLAPIAPLLVEEVWDHVPEQIRNNSVHPAKTLWTPLASSASLSEMDALSRQLRSTMVLSNTIKALQERLRADKKLGSSLECDVMIFVPESSSLLRFMQNYVEQLPGLFVVSNVQVRMASEAEAVLEEMEKMREWWAEDTLGDDMSFVSGESGKEDGWRVVVAQPERAKCVRCWRYLAPEPENLCSRCEEVVKEGESREI